MFLKQMQKFYFCNNIKVSASEGQLMYGVATNSAAKRYSKGICDSSTPCCDFLVNIGAALDKNKNDSNSASISSSTLIQITSVAVSGDGLFLCIVGYEYTGDSTTKTISSHFIKYSVDCGISWKTYVIDSTEDIASYCAISKNANQSYQAFVSLGNKVYYFGQAQNGVYAFFAVEHTIPIKIDALAITHDGVYLHMIGYDASNKIHLFKYWLDSYVITSEEILLPTTSSTINTNIIKVSTNQTNALINIYLNNSYFDGTNWHEYVSKDVEIVSSTCFALETNTLDGTSSYIVNNSSNFMISTDNCSSWTKSSNAETGTALSMNYDGTYQLYAINNTIYQTFNHGDSWIQTNIDSLSNPFMSDISNDGKIVLITNNSVVMFGKTTDYSNYEWTSIIF